METATAIGMGSWPAGARLAVRRGGGRMGALGRTRRGGADGRAVSGSRARGRAQTRARVEGSARPAGLPDLSNLSEREARAALLCVPVLWGVYSPAVRLLYAQPGPPRPSALAAVRGLLSTLLQARSLVRVRPDGTRPLRDAGLLRDGGLVGTLNFVGTSIEIVALQYTTAIRASFILGLVVVLVQLLAAAEGKDVSPRTWAAAALSATGVAVLVGDQDVLSTGLNTLPGDLLCCVCALLYAVNTTLVGRLAPRHRPEEFSAVKATTLLCFATLWVLGDGVALGLGDALGLDGQAGPTLWPGFQEPTSWGLLFVAALGPGAVASVLVAAGQRKIPAREAQFYYQGTALFAGAFSFAFIGETLPTQGLLGAALIVGAALVAIGGMAEERRKGP